MKKAIVKRPVFSQRGAIMVNVLMIQTVKYQLPAGNIKISFREVYKFCKGSNLITSLLLSLV